MSEQGYSGWKNYETWVVNLWLSNDEGTYDYIQEMASELADEHNGDERETRDELSGRIASFVDEMAPNLNGTMFADLLKGALDAVFWYEIAEAYAHDACGTYRDLYVEEEEEEEETESVEA